MKKLSIGFHPNGKRKNPKTLKTQILMRVILDGKKSEIRLPDAYDLSERDLLKWNPIIQRIESKDSDVNDYLNGIVSRRKLLDLDMLVSNANHTPSEIVEKLLGQMETKQEISVYEYSKRFLREDIENSFKEDGTKRNYRNAINQFCIFLDLMRWSKLSLQKFKFEHAQAFKKFLETPRNLLDSIKVNTTECDRLYLANQLNEKSSKKHLKVQNSEVSSSTKIKNISPVFEKAIDEDLIHKNPFKKIKLCFEGEEASTLTANMLKQIYYLENVSDGIEYTKDLFLFMCFTGMAYTDAINFNDSEFEFVEGNIHLLDTKRRKKTGCRIFQVLCDEAAIIVFKYHKRGYSINNSRVFPHESGESFNRKLKIIQTLANIPFTLSTKNGRITFKNTLRDSNIQNPLLTNKIMGWKRSSCKSIADLYDRFSSKDFIEAKITFDEYLKQILSKS